jgi:hypothetical protein
VVAETGGRPGGPALLARTLRDRRDRRPGPAFRPDDYRDGGGVRGTVVGTAEELYARMPAGEQDAVRELFLRLTTVGRGPQDTGFRIGADELQGPAGSEVTDAVLRRLVAARLIVVAEDIIEVAHEALISHWPRLRRWLAEDRDALPTHRALSATAHTWLRFGRDPDALYRGPRLTAARAWAERHPQALNAAEAALPRAATRRPRQCKALRNPQVVKSSPRAGGVVRLDAPPSAASPAFSPRRRGGPYGRAVPGNGQRSAAGGPTVQR